MGHVPTFFFFLLAAFVFFVIAFVIEYRKTGLINFSTLGWISLVLYFVFLGA